jgi:hypothetical protein
MREGQTLPFFHHYQKPWLPRSLRRLDARGIDCYVAKTGQAGNPPSMTFRKFHVSYDCLIAGFGVQEVEDRFIREKNQSR